MTAVVSADGTPIAFTKSGTGPAIILVVGAFNDQATGEPLAKALEQRFTVFNYDRRGRGKSGDTLPYAVEREIEDIDALIQEAGGSAFVFGYSSGAVLALRAASHGLAISRLALYDPPPTGPRAGGLTTQLAELIASNRRGDAVELFQTDGVGIPPEVVAKLRNAPFRPALERMAHTLVYEMSILTDTAMPPAAAAAVHVPTLVLVGEKNPDIMRQAAQTLAQALPQGQIRILTDQTHDISPEIVAPELAAFLI